MKAFLPEKGEIGLDVNRNKREIGVLIIELGEDKVFAVIDLGCLNEARIGDADYPPTTVTAATMVVYHILG